MSTTKEAPITVRASSMGYYNHKRRKPGAVFIISGETYKDGQLKGQLKDFSDKWMEKVEKDTPSAPAPTAEEEARNPTALSSPTPAPERTGRSEEDLGTPDDETEGTEVDSQSKPDVFSLDNTRKELEDKAKTLGTDEEVLSKCTNKAQVLAILKNCGVEVKE